MDNADDLLYERTNNRGRGIAVSGWYPDPSDPSRQRAFDGKTWTENYTPFTAPPRFPSSARQTAGNGKLFWPSEVEDWSHNLVRHYLRRRKLNDHKVIIFIESLIVVIRWVIRHCQLLQLDRLPTTPSGPSVAPAGSSVRDGKFEFQVLGVTRSASKEGVFQSRAGQGRILCHHTSGDEYRG